MEVHYGHVKRRKVKLDVYPGSSVGQSSDMAKGPSSFILAAAAPHSSDEHHHRSSMPAEDPSPYCDRDSRLTLVTLR
jgi:hypothetical protein